VGSLQAQEFASLTAAGDVSLEQSLAWHLRANHYPPVPLSMIEPCIQAIEIGQRYQWGDADLNDRVDLPDGVLQRGRLSKRITWMRSSNQRRKNNVRNIHRRMAGDCSSVRDCPDYRRDLMAAK
jgi:hypothetical protein